MSFSRSVLWQAGHIGVVPARTSASNALPQLLHVYSKIGIVGLSRNYRGLPVPMPPVRAALLSLALAAVLGAATVRTRPAGSIEAAGTGEPDSTLASRIAEAAEGAVELPRLRSLLVSSNGNLVLERYFRGTRAGTLANIKSASKSVMSALVGVAIRQGILRDVSEPIAPHFRAELAPSADPR